VQFRSCTGHIRFLFPELGGRDLDGAVPYIDVDKKPPRHPIGYVRAELQLVRYKTSKISTSFVGTDDASSSGMEVYG
jgi:hypothetical protein